MFGETWQRSEHYHPWTYINGVAVDATVTFIGLHVIFTVVSTLLVAFGGSWVWELLVLRSASEAFSLKIYTLLTYPFPTVLSSGLGGLFFVIKMFFLYQVGQEIEKFIGTRSFAFMYFLLAAVPALTFAILGWVVPGFGAVPFVDSHYMVWSVMIGFAMIYPGVQFFFGISAKWIAIIFVGVMSLVTIGNPAEFLLLWLTIGTGFLYMKWEGVAGGLPLFDWIQNYKANQEEKAFKERRRKWEEAEYKKEASVDAVLDKISKQGMGSLTDEEKKVLERASSDLRDKK